MPAREVSLGGGRGSGNGTYGLWGRDLAAVVDTHVRVSSRGMRWDGTYVRRSRAAIACP
jgi:hypothetical protein